jgi:hypothetical protein
MTVSPKEDYPYPLSGYEIQPRRHFLALVTSLELLKLLLGEIGREYRSAQGQKRREDS